MASFTASEWRDIGHARWRDPNAALENTDGEEFKNAVRYEDQVWKKEVKQHWTAVKEWKEDMELFQDSAWPESPDFAHIRYEWNGEQVIVQYSGAAYTQNVWIHNWSIQGCSDFTVVNDTNIFYLIEDIGSGAEKLQLRVYEWRTNSSPKLLWSRDHIGPSHAVVGEHILYTGVENALRYSDIRVADLRTGAGERVIFQEPDKRIQVSLEQRGGTVFVHLANALFQRLGILVGSRSVRWITNTVKSTLVPVSQNIYISDKTIHHLSGKIEKLPKGHFIVDAVANGDSIFLVVVSEGKTSLWRDKKPLFEVEEGLSNIEIIHESNLKYPTFILHRPDCPGTLLEYRGELIGLVQTLQYPQPLKLRTLHTGFAISADGTNVPYTIVSHVPNPKYLLVDGYGAYGISSRRSYPVRWLAWLKRGYAFVYSCPRGGRENGDVWYDGARTALRKHKTFEDVGAVIAEAQKQTGVKPRSTVFFGRSAGGWTAAHVAQSYGHLVASVYAEVPYVDVLRTTTNPELPLTQLEYDEFGDPIHRPDEFAALKKISPVDTVSSCKSVCPTVVVRTALNDMQVLPYESLKWSARLREKGWNRVFVGIDHNGGHFAPRNTMIGQRAEDAAILNYAIMKRTSRKSLTKRSPGRSVAFRAGRGRTLRRTSSRKH
jgi:hypothetical protein